MIMRFYNGENPTKSSFLSNTWKTNFLIDHHYKTVSETLDSVAFVGIVWCSCKVLKGNVSVKIGRSRCVIGSSKLFLCLSCTSFWFRSKFSIDAVWLTLSSTITADPITVGTLTVKKINIALTHEGASRITQRGAPTYYFSFFHNCIKLRKSDRGEGGRRAAKSATDTLQEKFWLEFLIDSQNKIGKIACETYLIMLFLPSYVI